MSDKYLSRREFMKIGAVAAGVIGYAARTAGAKGVEETLGSEKSIALEGNSTNISPGLYELGRQMIQREVCSRRIPQSYLLHC